MQSENYTSSAFIWANLCICSYSQTMIKQNAVTDDRSPRTP